MMSDIVKQIVLKFKTEGGSEVQRQIQAMTRAGGLRPQDVNKTLENLQKINQSFSKAGMQTSAEFGKVKKILEELNTRHVEQFARKIDRVTKLIANQADELERLKNVNAPEDRVNAQLNRIKAANALLNRISEGGPTVPAAPGDGGIPNLPRGYTPTQPYSGPPSALSMMIQNARGPWNMNLYGAVAGGVGWAAGEAREYLENRGQIRSAYSSRLKDTAEARYQGNLTRGALGQEGYYKKVEEETRNRMRARDVQQSAYGVGNVAEIVGGFGLTAASVAATVASFGTASPVTLATGATGLGLMGHGAYGLYQKGKYALQGRDIEKAQVRAQVEQEKLNETMTPELLAQFRSTQRSRMELANQFQMNSGEMYGFRMGAYGNQFEEGEAVQAAQSLRRFGNRNAMNLAGGAMTAARMQGTSLGAATGQISAMALNAIGGEKKASDNLREVFSVGVASGIKDSGMLDGFKELVGGLIAGAGTRMDAGRVADVVAKSMNTQDVREMQNLPGGMQGVGALAGGKGGSTLDQQLKFNSALELLKSKGIEGPRAISMASQMQQMGAMEGLSGGTAMLRTATGLSDKEVTQWYAKNLESRLTRYSEGRDVSAGFKPGATAQQKAQAAIYAADIEGTGQDVGAKMVDIISGNLYGGTAGAKALAGKSSLDILKEGQGQEVDIYNKTQATAEGKAETERFKGIAQMDKDVQDKIATNIDSIISTYKDTVVKTFEEVGTQQLNKSVGDIVTAADSLASALENAAARINGNSSYSTATPSNNKKGP